MAETMYGYVRVSTREQNEDRQMLAMERFGVERRNIFLDKQSGQDFNRPRYRGLLRRMREGDVLGIKSIDRLGRNYEEILEQWRCITREKKAAIVVLDMPLLDTRQSRSLMGTLIADIVLQLLSYVAQTERELIHQRQAEGIAAAKARGVRFGPPPKARPENYARCLLAWQSGAISAREAARQLQVSHKTLIRMIAHCTQRPGPPILLTYYSMLGSQSLPFSPQVRRSLVPRPEYRNTPEEVAQR